MPVRKVGPDQFEAEPQIDYEAGCDTTSADSHRAWTERQKMYDGILARVRKLRRSHYEYGGAATEVASEEVPALRRNLDFPGDLFFGSRGRVEANPAREEQQ